MTVRTAIKNVLKNMVVTEVSLVDEGDNPHADIVYKRREVSPAAALESFAETVAKLNGLALGEEGTEGAAEAANILKGVNMTIEELNEKLGEIETSLDTVTKAKDAAETEVADLKAQLETVSKERDEAVAKAKPAAESDEDVLKALPEPIRKRLLDAEAAAKSATEAVEKANAEREEAEFVTKAKALGAEGEEATKLGATLHRIAKGKSTVEDATAVEALVTKAKAIAAEGKVLFEAIGKTAGGDVNDAVAKLNGIVEAIKKAKPTLTHEQAYSEALDANPALYDEVRKIKPTA